MRSYEVPAMGACMLLEDTPEHRAIFGEDGAAVVYFDSTDGLLDRVRWLLAHEPERRRLAEAAHRLIVDGHNTYADRLTAMLGASVPQPSGVGS
jgi:spore maturation protein CgeB